MDRLSPGLLYHEDPEADGVVIRDDQARPVARLALTAGGEVSAAAGRWMIAAERDRRGWMVVARDVESEQPVGCAYPRGVLSSFDLWIAPEREYALRERPLAAVWTLRGDLGEIARFTSEPRTIRLAESPVPDPELQLVVLLAHEAIRYSEGIPSAAPPSGGG